MVLTSNWQPSVNCRKSAVINVNRTITMEPTKLSFGFKKPLKKPCLLPPTKLEEPTEGRKELIDCLEGQAIKVKGAVAAEVKQPLVIPLKDNEKNLLDRIRAVKNRDKLKQTPEVEDLRPDSELTEEELAARQLIKEAKARLANGSAPTGSNKVTILPLNEQPLEGEKEPTLEDYESVPISDYGLALLRGMGWKEGMAIGKNQSKVAPLKAPELRPKGLGLGAVTVVQAEGRASDQHGNPLVLTKGAHAKVLAGPHKSHYCQVQGFDEEAGRVIVRVHPQGAIVNINETLLKPVTKEEFLKGSKFLNNAKYEEYQEISEKKLQELRDRQAPSHSRPREEEKASRRERHRSRTPPDKSRRSSSEEERKTRKSSQSKHRDRSRSGGRRSERREARRKNKKCKSRHRRSTSSSDEERPHRSKRE